MGEAYLFVDGFDLAVCVVTRTQSVPNCLEVETTRPVGCASTTLALVVGFAAIGDADAVVYWAGEREASVGLLVTWASEVFNAEVER